MGVAPTIDEQAKKNAAFQEYIDKQTDAMNKSATAAQADMKAAMDQFYADGKWDDVQPLLGGSYQQLETASTWSLDHVSQMISAVRGAIFGGSPAPAANDPKSALKPLGTGTTVATPSPSAITAISQMADMDLLIASAAFDAIQGILTAFTSSTNTKIVRNFDKKPLAPGLMLFVTVMENQYSRSDFFTDETIVQNFYIFDARISVKQAIGLAQFNQVQTYITQQAAYETGAAKVSGLIGALDVARADYIVALQKLQKILDVQNATIDSLQTKINGMRATNRSLAAEHIAAKRLAKAA